MFLCSCRHNKVTLYFNTYLYILVMAFMVEILFLYFKSFIASLIKTNKVVD